MQQLQAVRTVGLHQQPDLKALIRVRKPRLPVALRILHQVAEVRTLVEDAKHLLPLRIAQAVAHRAATAHRTVVQQQPKTAANTQPRHHTQRRIHAAPVGGRQPPRAATGVDVTVSVVIPVAVGR